MNTGAYEEKERSEARATAVPIALDQIGTRIEKVADSIGGKRSLANKAGIHETQLYKYIKGTNAPSLAVIAAIADAGGVSLDWLIRGETEEKTTRPAPGESLNEGEYAYVPLYDARCSAGHGSWTDAARVLTRLVFTRYSLRKKGLDPENLAAVRVDGDSMEPVLQDGDTLLIDLTRNTMESEGIYVLRLDDHLYAKRLQRQLDGALTIISANKEYSPITVLKDRLNELDIIGRAVWAGRWLF